MERLWAPWRMAYINGSDAAAEGKPSSPPGCIFCVKPGEARDAENWIVHRGPTCFVTLNAYPYTNGPLMAAPYRPLSRLCDLSAEENAEMLGLAALMTAVLGDVSGPDGYNIGMNLGRVAGAGIADHLHLHIVPRWNGDTNFMPVLGDVKVMPESLDQVYGKLTEALARRVED